MSDDHEPEHRTSWKAKAAWGAAALLLAEALQVCADAAIAARRFQLHHERWPASLAEIIQSLGRSEAEPLDHFTDPFNGQPLRFKVEPTRILIYSVYEDGLDDGGNRGPNPIHKPYDVGIHLMK